MNQWLNFAYKSRSALIVTHVVGESRKYRYLLGIDLYDGIDRHEKWHQPFSMATTVPRNGIDRFKWQRPFTKGKFASPLLPFTDTEGVKTSYLGDGVR